jgi:putative hemolysin
MLDIQDVSSGTLSSNSLRSGYRPRETGPVLGRLANLEVRIARSDMEIDGAYEVRRRVFLEDGQGTDTDRFDSCCDHLVVVDTGENRVVGTYRLIDRHAAQAAGSWYSESEFDLAPMMQAHPDLSFLEFGRSCILKEFRSKRTLELLWHGSWAWVVRNRHDVMFGCASFEGTDPELHREALSFLHHNASGKDDWQVCALPALRGDFEPMAPEDIDLKRALRALPTLIKGYMKLGAKFSAEPAIDHEFGTTDILVILPVADLNPRYVNYYGANAERHAA